MNNIIFILILFLCVSCGTYFPIDPATNDTCAFRTDRGFMVRWEELPIPVYIHSGISKKGRRNIIYSIDMWNESWNYYTGAGVLFEFIGDINVDNILNENNINSSRDNINVIFVDTKNRMLQKKQQGSTFIQNAFGGAIVEADIVINNIHYQYYYEKDDFDYSLYTQIPELSTYRSFTSAVHQSVWKKFIYVFNSVLDFFTFWKDKEDRTPAAAKTKNLKGKVDFISLILHELGHLGALQHIDNVDSIMNYRLKKGVMRRTIRETELSKLLCGYSR